jgi:hypothetical protein
MVWTLGYMFEVEAASQVVSAVGSISAHVSAPVVQRVLVLEFLSRHNGFHGLHTSYSLAHLTDS